MTDSARSSSFWSRHGLAFALMGAVVLVRVLAVLLSPLDLYADEAQYWRWGQTLDWGYYSKPPMIAWVLHAMTAVFGDTERGVRLAAPVLHGIAATFLYLTGRDMLSPRAGLLAALTYLLMPAVALSSAVISTDGVLMPFFSAALFALWRLRSSDARLRIAVLFGAALGLGLLAKYAMLYFYIGLALAILIDRPTRQALLSRTGAIAAAIALVIIIPHFLWNAAHDFETVAHTVDNANLGGDLLNPENALKFFVDQMGVFGPIAFLTLALGLIAMRNKDAATAAEERWLMCFILPVIGFILAQSVISRANANWAATAYPAASLLVIAWLRRAKRNAPLWWVIAALTFVCVQLIPDFTLPTRLGLGAALALGVLAIGWTAKFRPSGLIGANIGLNGVLALAICVIALLPPGASTALGLDNAMKRARGWDATAAQVYAAAEAQGATAILVDEREVWHGLDFYGRTRAIPLISWRRYAGPKSFSERVALEDVDTSRVMIVSIHADLRAHVRSDFAQSEPSGRVTVALGQRGNGCPIERSLQLYMASGYEPDVRNAAWEARHANIFEFPDAPCPAPKTAP